MEVSIVVALLSFDIACGLYRPTIVLRCLVDRFVDLSAPFAGEKIYIEVKLIRF